MPDLHALLLAEIERREDCEHCGHRKVEHFGEWCRAVTGAVTADGGTRICGCEGASHDDPALAYLAALRGVVEIHRDWPSTITYADGTVIEARECRVCMDGECGEICRTLRCVAEALGVEVDG